MPVDLSLLPAPLPKLKKFNIWFWVILLVIFIIIGAMTTFVLSFFYAFTNLLFLFCVLVLPGLLWLFCLLYGIYSRGYREAYIKQWNEHREQRREELITYAQRALYVLDYQLMTGFGRAGNANGVSSHQYAITAQQPTNGGNPVPHSAIKIPDNMSSNFFEQRLKSIFSNWLVAYKSSVSKLPANVAIHVHFFIDMPLESSCIEKVWMETLGKLVSCSSYNINQAATSTQFMEQWLDNSDHDDEILVVVSAHLFSAPKSGAAESAQLFILAGKNLVTSGLINADELTAKVYRSEQTGELQKTLDNALLWGQAVPKTYDGIWYSGVSQPNYLEMMQYFNEIEFDFGDIFNVDTSIGDANHDAYWLLLALAIEQTIKTKNNQMIVVGKPDITASVVTHI